MVDGDLFDKLAKIAGMLGKGAEPFGGIQVCSIPSVHETLILCFLAYRDRRFLSITSCNERRSASEVRFRGRNVEKNRQTYF